MPKYINADEAIKDLEYDLQTARYSYLDSDECEKQIAAIERAIEHLRSCEEVDVQEVIHAKWEINSDGYYPYCSHCKNEPENGKMTKWCSECGARMDVKEK